MFTFFYAFRKPLHTGRDARIQFLRDNNCSVLVPCSSNSVKSFIYNNQLSKNNMNYFPSFLDFKNTNQYNINYPSYYGHQNTFFGLPRQAFYQNTQNPQFLMHRNSFDQNFFNQMTEQVDKIHHDFQPESLHSQKPLEIIKNKNNTKKQKKQKYVFKQKEGRNMISNLFRQALKCILLQRDKNVQVIQKIARSNNIQVNARDFLQNLYKKTKNLKNYVRIGQIEVFLRGKENERSKQQAKVLRILLYRFLRNDIIPCLCNNSKVQSNNRMMHISQRRKLESMIMM